MTSTTNPSKARVYNWTFPGSPIQIQLRLDVVETLAKLVQRGSPDDPARPPETGGILLGKVTQGGTRVEIIHSRPFTSGHWNGGKRYVLQSSDRKRLTEAILEAQLQPGALSVVGFYRTHLRPDLSLDEDDLSLMRECFPDPHSVALLIRPSAVGPPVAGFFFREKGEINSQFSFLEFPFEASELAENARRLPPTHNDRASNPARGKLSWPPKWLSSCALTLRSPRTWIVGAVLVAALALLYYRKNIVGQIQAHTSGVANNSTKNLSLGTIGLQVETRGTDLRVSWNRVGQALANAKIGILSIKDGVTERRVYLDPVQLRTGTAMYSPVADNVQFRLEILSATGESADEQVIALVPASRQPSHAGDRTVPSRDTLHSPTVDSAVNTNTNQQKPVNRPGQASPLDLRKGLQSRGPVVTEFVLPPPPTLVGITPPISPSISVFGGLPAIGPPAEPARTSPAKSAEGISSAPDQRTSTGPPQPGRYVAPLPLRRVLPVVPATVRAMLTSEVDIEVNVHLDETGRITSARVQNVNGRMAGSLSTPALEAVRQWTFQPARLRNQNVPSEITVQFRFSPVKEPLSRR